MDDKTFCPVHLEVQSTIREIKAKQDSQHCLTHESDIRHLQEAVVDIKIIHRDQWSAINKLRWVVAMGAGGAGVLAFLGSIIGAWLKK